MKMQAEPLVKVAQSNGVSDETIKEITGFKEISGSNGVGINQEMVMAAATS